jgi:phosphosulfolactate phosphohydrolase-like enzyme
VVLVPAGLTGHPEWNAQEDWVAAAFIAMSAGSEVGEGRERFEHWRARIAKEGLGPLFATAPHAEKLREIGLDADVGFCARVDVTAAVPRMARRIERGVALVAR